MNQAKRTKIITDGNRRANEYFYNGNGGEYFLMASLSRRRFDAFKLPVDYGFDVLAMDPLTAASRSHDLVVPYYFQVKTVYVKDLHPSVLSTKNGKRNVVTIPVKLKKDTLDLMEDDANKAIIVYVYDRNRKHAGLELEDCPSFYFWINGKTIRNFKGILVQEEREDYRICWINIVYPENPERLSDEENSQNTYVTLGTDFLTEDNDAVSINRAGKSVSWDMYHSMNDEQGKYFRLSGFFEEAGKGGEN